MGAGRSGCTDLGMTLVKLEVDAGAQSDFRLKVGCGREAWEKYLLLILWICLHVESLIESAGWELSFSFRHTSAQPEGLRSSLQPDLFSPESEGLSGNLEPHAGLSPSSAAPSSEETE